MVMRVIDSTSESEVMTPMTRSDGIGKHRPVVGPAEYACRFESCLQWVAIFKHTKPLVESGADLQATL